MQLGFHGQINKWRLKPTATAINSSLQDTQEHSGYPSISTLRQEVNHKLETITAWVSWRPVATTTLPSDTVRVMSITNAYLRAANNTLKCQLTLITRKHNHFFPITPRAR